MKYDLEKTFKFVTNDKEWVKKLLIGGGLTILSVFLFLAPVITMFGALKSPANTLQGIPLLVVCWIIAGVIMLGVNGFSLQAAHDYIDNPETPLPQWGNFKSLLFTGFKAALGTVLLYLPVIFLGLAIALVIHPVKGTASDTMFSVISNLVSLFYALIVYAFSANFIQEFNVFDYANYAKAYRVIKGNLLDYGILVLVALAMGIVFNVGAVLVSLTIVGVLAVPFGAFYIQIVTAVLTARFVQITREDKATQDC